MLPRNSGRRQEEGFGLKAARIVDSQRTGHPCGNPPSYGRDNCQKGDAHGMV